jgi:hypothetical protein
MHSIPVSGPVRESGHTSQPAGAAVVGHLPGALYITEVRAHDAADPARSPIDRTAERLATVPLLCVSVGLSTSRCSNCGLSGCRTPDPTALQGAETLAAPRAGGSRLLVRTASLATPAQSRSVESRGYRLDCSFGEIGAEINSTTEVVA